MPAITAGSLHGEHACHCLNIRIRPGDISQVTAPPPPEDQAFSQLFVDEEGISVVHPQFTVRTRTRGTAVAETSRFSRYTSVTCLQCQLVVYRVYQTYAPEIEKNEGPLLPTEDWVERDVLKGQNGWIEVHNDCLTGNAIEEALSSANFSELFNVLVLPTDSPETPPQAIFERPPSRSSTRSPPPPQPNFFSNVRPVFLPPPFTPSHPVFLHLAEYAAKESQIVRDAAEEYMTQQMKLKTEEIENADAELRRKVNTLWKNFRDGVSRIQQETGHFSERRGSSSRSRERSAINGLDTTTTSGTPSASVVRNFVPTSVTRPRSSSPPAPRMSALSASLKTSSFHHPRATATSPPPHHRSPSAMSNGTNGTTHSPSSEGSLGLAIPQSASTVLQVRRNMTDGIDTAASYRFFVTLEADKARQQRGRPQTVSEEVKDAGSSDDQVATDNSQKQPDTSKPPPVSPSREKGKRKVTFQDKPAVVTIKREVAAEQREQAELAALADTDMIFPLEDLEDIEGESLDKTQPTLQLIEQPSAPVRPRRLRPQNTDNLSTSFSGLRPSSLPAPSHIRPSRNGTDVFTPPIMMSLPKAAAPTPMQASTSAGGDHSASSTESSDGQEIPPQDPRILKLVAAETPSHRGAWKPESKAWQTFVRRQGSHHEAEAIPEEGEDGGETDASGFAIPDVLPKHMQQPAIVGSLPVAMKLPKQSEPLSLFSYQPKTLAAQASLVSPTNRRKSSTSIRRAVYAVRDRSRTLDPGPLDFASVNDDDDEDVGEDELRPAEASLDGERSRQIALKILKARNEIPDSGMWRSLA
ncbi:hypothetical protein H0H92_011127 [Tricholoma furcatifolium]|nr:hypothetical protein H0H92_011127 [Tricholoma furcatifolium]